MPFLGIVALFIEILGDDDACAIVEIEPEFPEWNGHELKIS
jgi:hypothetical protein